ASEVRARLLFPMVDEAFRCLAERVVANTDELDVAFAFGIGFPAFTGSLTGFAAAEGLGRIVETLDELARRAHPGLAASDALRQRACTRAWADGPRTCREFFSRRDACNACKGGAQTPQPPASWRLRGFARPVHATPPPHRPLSRRNQQPRARAEL